MRTAARRGAEVHFDWDDPATFEPATRIRLPWARRRHRESVPQPVHLRPHPPRQGSRALAGLPQPCSRIRRARLATALTGSRRIPRGTWEDSSRGSRAAKPTLRPLPPRVHRPRPLGVPSGTDRPLVQPVSRETGRRTHESGGPFSCPVYPIDAGYWASDNSGCRHRSAEWLSSFALLGRVNDSGRLPGQVSGWEW